MRKYFVKGHICSLNLGTNQQFILENLSIDSLVVRVAVSVLKGCEFETRLCQHEKICHTIAVGRILVNT